MSKKLGQYFTTDKTLQEKVYSFILNDPEILLEPSVGRGDLLEYIYNKNPNVIFDMYEIDEKLPLLKFLKKENVKYSDFLQENIEKKYKTIIGNPPYVKSKNGNLYLSFTEKCYNLLDENGELIFIVPSDFFKLTSASHILDNMMKNGLFTHVYHPHNEKLFDDANIDVLIYRYCKGVKYTKTLYNQEQLYSINVSGFVTFSKSLPQNSKIFTDYFNIYVGMVSGKESVYKNSQIGNLDLTTGKNKVEKYIYIEKFPCEDEKINEYLLSYKKSLISRKIRKFNEDNWYEWGAPRNITKVRNSIGEDCIYIYNLTRKKQIAFLGKVNYFGGGLIMLKPNKSCNLSEVIDYLNSDEFKNNFIFSGRFKIGHRQLSNSYFPF